MGKSCSLVAVVIWKVPARNPYLVALRSTMNLPQKEENKNFKTESFFLVGWTCHFLESKSPAPGAVWLMRNAMNQMTYFRAPKMCCVPWYSSDPPEQQRTTTCFGIQLASSWQIQSLWAHSSDIGWGSRGFLLTFQILKCNWL